MHPLIWIAERRIEEAVSRGELDRLPNAGAPLDLHEDPLVPEEMRMAKRILKNADVSLGEIFAQLHQRRR